MEINVLLRLLLAHLFGDFLLQPHTWVIAKAIKKERSATLYYHVVVVTVLSYILLWDWGKWYVPLIIMVSHLAIDIWKSYAGKDFLYFVVDQLLHVSVIVLIWLLFYNNKKAVVSLAEMYVQSNIFWLIIIAYYFVIGPLGVAIGLATKKWQADAGMDKGGLDKAGMWIGRCERVLVLTFIITNQYTALGFLMAAKSILRFGDKEARTQKKTEYILVGTLISFASAATIGAITVYLLQKQ